MIGLLVNGSTSCPFLGALVVLTWYVSIVVAPALIVEISVPPPVAAFAQAGWSPGEVGASELAVRLDDVAVASELMAWLGDEDELAGSVLGATEPPQAARPSAAAQATRAAEARRRWMVHVGSPEGDVGVRDGLQGAS